MARLTAEFGTQIMPLVYFSSEPYSSIDSLNQFDAYNIPTNMTPQAIFKGNPSNRIMGGGDTTYTQYRERILSLLNQKSSILLKSNNPTSLGGRIAVNVTVTNSGTDNVLGAALYAVFYKRLNVNGYNNMVMGVTPVVTIPNLAAGSKLDYQLQDDTLAYDNSYGVMVIIKTSSGVTIQALKVK